MLDQLKIGDKYSYDDFGASVASRVISPPKKKVIKETVPFSNIAYDFSKIDGELYWEERELEYTFEILGDSPEDLEAKKTAFSCWIMNIMGEEIHDPYEPNFHYLGTFDELVYADEDCVEKTVATVKFSAYPYKIANEATQYTFKLSPTAFPKIQNDSAHRVVPTVTAEYPFSATMNGVTYNFPAGESRDYIFAFEGGLNDVDLKSKAGYLVMIDEAEKFVLNENYFYRTCTVFADGTFELSDLVTPSSVSDVIGCWWASYQHDQLFLITAPLNESEVMGIEHLVMAGAPSSNEVKFAFNCEVF